MTATEIVDLDGGTDGLRPTPAPRDPLRLTLLAVLAVAALVIAGGVGWLVRGDGGSGSASVSESSVDAGFARDMSTHHTQAVIMAGYTRDTTTDPAVKNLAFDIESAQNAQVGEMTGWLDSWGLTRSSSEPLMGWMGGTSADMSGMDGMDASAMASMTPSATTAPGDTSLMPGMATPNEVTKLETMTGKALDVYFLQLMLRHHEGGLQMAQYAAAHAQLAYVRNLAQKMVDSQNNEITVMKTMLAERGAQPLS